MIILSMSMNSNRSSSSSSNVDANAVFLPRWFVPTEKDVICGWARQNHRHPGNQRFRKLVEHSVPLYLAAKTKNDKTQVIAAVVEKVRRDSVGGGFVKKDHQTGLWFEIGDDKARDKVGHAIRRVIDEEKKVKVHRAREHKALSERKQLAGGAAKRDEDYEDNADLFKKGMALASFLDGFVETNNNDSVQSNSVQSKASKFGGKSGDLQTLQSLQSKSDGVVVPSFLYNQRPTPSQNDASVGISSHSLNQEPFASSNSARSAPSQNNPAVNLSSLAQSSNASVGLESWLNPLPLQNLPRPSWQMMGQTTGESLLPRSPHFNQSADVQQARLSALMEQQREMNNLIAMQQQNNFSLAGEPGPSGINAPNDAAYLPLAGTASNNVVPAALFPSSLSGMGGGSSPFIGQYGPTNNAGWLPPGGGQQNYGGLSNAGSTPALNEFSFLQANNGASRSDGEVDFSNFYPSDQHTNGEN
mmetsp:Transcript_10349/g.18504  ORF Transcript_10349/g.18504 Transcript_10349/m.18504 type:complete len:472 (-) Transcript_10349:377-1792(-)